jgi:transcriptional regulator with XRE-family HTH domain
MAQFDISPVQCRAARALIDWSRESLAEASRVGLRTLVDFERGARKPRDVTLDALRRALEAKGVEFLDGEQPGVRLRPGFSPQTTREKRKSEGEGE